MPGDQIQFINGEIFLNNNRILKKPIKTENKIRCGSNDYPTKSYQETLPNGVKYIAVYKSVGTLLNTDKYIVPKNHFFFLGDNRDCSKDSRYLSSVGYVKRINIVGKAKYIFFSNDTIKGSVFKFWNWNNSMRLQRFFKKIK